MATQTTEIRTVPPSAHAQPGNLTYELDLDSGKHLWRLEGSGGLISTIDAADAPAAMDWAAARIAAGDVPNLPTGTRVDRWEYATDGSCQWLVPVLVPLADRDRDRDRAAD